MGSGLFRGNVSDLYLDSTLRPPRKSFGETVKRRARYLEEQARIFYFVFRHPRTRWYVRLMAICSAAYVLSPVQLLPNFIPVIGCLDDVVVILLAARVIRRATPPEVLAQCRECAEARGAEGTIGPATAPFLIIAVWILAAFVASALLATYIYF